MTSTEDASSRGSDRRPRPVDAWILCLLAVVVAAGCGSSPTVRYYDLVTEEAAEVRKTGDAVVGLGPFAMPEYLKRPHIVLRGEGHALEISEFERWVEPPDVAFTRWLGARTDRQLPGAVVLSYPYASLGTVDYRVRGAIRRWDADVHGDAVLVVQWSVTAADGVTTLPLHTSTFVATATDPADYESIVAALRATLDAFAEAIVAGMEPVLAMATAP